MQLIADEQKRQTMAAENKRLSDGASSSVYSELDVAKTHGARDIESLPMGEEVDEKDIKEKDGVEFIKIEKRGIDMAANDGGEEDDDDNLIK